MELFLNILWLLLAIALLWVWRTRWVRERRPASRDTFREWTSVSIVLVLLFFAVSLTDDLHSELIIFEECSVSRRNSVAVARASHSTQPDGVVLHLLASAILPRIFSVPISPAVYCPRSVEYPQALSLPNDGPSARAPPAVPL